MQHFAGNNKNLRLQPSTYYWEGRWPFFAKPKVPNKNARHSENMLLNFLTIANCQKLVQNAFLFSTFFFVLYFAKKIRTAKFMFIILASETSKNGLTFSCYLVSTLDSLFFCKHILLSSRFGVGNTLYKHFFPHKIFNSK